MRDDRTRPWKKLRVVVEVTVPPNNRATEKDLVYSVSQALPHAFALPRPIHNDAHSAVVRVKAFTPFVTMWMRLEKGIKHLTRRKEPR